VLVIDDKIFEFSVLLVDVCSLSSAFDELVIVKSGLVVIFLLETKSVASEFLLEADIEFSLLSLVDSAILLFLVVLFIISVIKAVVCELPLSPNNFILCFQLNYDLSKINNYHDNLPFPDFK
jgi:hypothetical protein